MSVFFETRSIEFTLVGACWSLLELVGAFAQE